MTWAGIELNLDFHVLGDGEQGRAHFIDQHFARLFEAIDIGRIAIAVLRQLLHQQIVVIARAKTQAQSGLTPVSRLAADKVLQLFRIVDADIESLHPWPRLPGCWRRLGSFVRPAHRPGECPLRLRLTRQLGDDPKRP